MPGLFRLFSRRSKTGNATTVDGEFKLPLESSNSNKRSKKFFKCSVVFLDGSTCSFDILVSVKFKNVQTQGGLHKYLFIFLINVIL